MDSRFTAVTVDRSTAARLKRLAGGAPVATWLREHTQALELNIKAKADIDTVMAHVDKKFNEFEARWDAWLKESEKYFQNMTLAEADKIAGRHAHKAPSE